MRKICHLRNGKSVKKNGGKNHLTLIHYNQNGSYASIRSCFNFQCSIWNIMQLLIVHFFPMYHGNCANNDQLSRRTGPPKSLDQRTNGHEKQRNHKLCSNCQYIYPTSPYPRCLIRLGISNFFH